MYARTCSGARVRARWIAFAEPGSSATEVAEETRRDPYVARRYFAGMPIGRAVEFAVAIFSIVAAASLWGRQR